MPNLMHESGSRHLWPLGYFTISPIMGFARGLRSPSVHLYFIQTRSSLDLFMKPEEGLRTLAKILGIKLLVPTHSSENASYGSDLLHMWCKTMITALSKIDPILGPQIIGSPLLKGYKNISDNRDAVASFRYSLTWPTYWPEILSNILFKSLEWWKKLSVASSQVQGTALQSEVQDNWARLRNEVVSRLPPGHNPPHILSAARALGIPVTFIDKDLILLGYGRRSRLMRSTLTDITPAMALAGARDKIFTNRLLHFAAIPVPQNFEVHTLDRAIEASKRLGFPVVVKPADQDRGSGARANLKSLEQVRSAFENAAKFTKRILVEKHIEGNEYRLTVVNGELLWAHQRIPATVTGDGVHTIHALVQAENNHRRQALLNNPKGLEPIKLEQDDLTYILELGLSLESTPRDGEVIRLQRVPAATTGGTGKAYFDLIHPDNRLVAERAAQTLRLDIAGVDFIMPDIQKSWREVGGAVTEVNAIPQISIQTDPTLPQKLLKKIMPHGGRIPVMVVLTHDDLPTWIQEVSASLIKRGLCVGLASDSGLWIGNNLVREGSSSVWKDAKTLGLDKSVEAIIIVTNGKDFIGRGIPFDFINIFVLDAHIPKSLELFMPYTMGTKIVGNSVISNTGFTKQNGWSVWPDDVSTKNITELIIQEILDAT